MKTIFAILCALALAGSPRAADATNEVREGLLQLADGSSLHGGLESIGRESGLKWEHPAAAEPLQFRLANIEGIRFEHANAPEEAFEPSSRFYFKNGDEIIGKLQSIENGSATIESWFGESLRAPVGMLESITFSAKGYKLLYEGPDGPEGWKIGRNQRSWEYKDGEFIANGADLLGRDFGIQQSSSLEFDLAWNGPFSLSITLYAQKIDRFDYSTSAYLVYLGTGAISVQRVQAGTGAVMLGQTQIPRMLQRNKMHFEIRCNKDDATIALYADGDFIQKWKDSAGFVAKGTGIVFFSQVEPRALRLSNIRVAEWEGKFEPEPLTNAPPELDVVFLANRDRVLGKVRSLADGEVSVETKQTRLDIPVERVTQIQFAEGEEAAAPESEGLVRASFPGGESLLFELESWGDGKVAGTSGIFGPVAFSPNRIRQITFSPEGAEPEQGAAIEFQFPDFE